jgi:3(or 17)beta-hydroxysteroid dehydrogenase
MSARVQGKVAIVTGAASGIGRGCAELLAREGARVWLVDVDEDGGRAAAAALGEPHAFRRLDVTDEDGWASLVAEVGALHILVNAAGIGVLADIESTTVAQFRKTYAINVEGVFLGCRAAIGAMKQSGGGSIVNLSSVAGLVADPGLAAYCASKGAVRLLTKSIALHCARKRYGIRCNSVHPSFIDTPMVAGMAEAMGDADKARDILTKAAPLGRLGTVEEVANLVLYLSSDESSFTTGSELVIDGGLTAR